MRAVTQNRDGVVHGHPHPWVDALTFGLGSGIAGIAGVALSQIDNVSPNLGQGYIIDSFMVVVFGGVGNLWGTLVGAMTLGVANKFLEPYAGAVLAKILILVLIILFIQKRPRGLFALKGRAVEHDHRLLFRALDRKAIFRRLILCASAFSCRCRTCFCRPSHPLHVPTTSGGAARQVSDLCLLALALDLVWGYCGILSLGHGAFFALGGYAMGMYLMRQIGTRGVYGHPVLPDFMVFLNWKELPWYWYGFDQFWFAAS
jgi:branched-subunit amino acid ABC-type transport system permease component